MTQRLTNDEVVDRALAALSSGGVKTAEVFLRDAMSGSVDTKDGEIESVIARDDLLANISLYWFTGAIGSSLWPYYARMHGPWPIPDSGVKVPMGYAEFPREIVRPPRSVAERTYTDIRRWTVMPRGGHFAAMEQPAALAHEIVAFFRPLRPR